MVAGANFFDTTSRGFTLTQLASTASYKAKNLQGIGLNWNNLTDVDLSGQNLTNADLSGSTLTNANLSGAVVMGVDFTSTTNGSFTHAQLASTASFQAKNLQGIRLNGNDLSGWDFREQSLVNSSFTGANLSNADFDGADLRNAWFVERTTEAAFFNNTILTAADTRGTRGLNSEQAISTNMIDPIGRLRGLSLHEHDSLIVRDHDGDERYPIPVPPLPVFVESNMSLSGEATLRLVFESDPWDSLISFEPGIPVELGGALELTFADDVDVATQVGRTLRLFDWTGVSPTGQFTVSSPYTWNLSNLYTTGEVTLTAVPAIPGDFNSDGIVDAADYVVWRSGLGTVYTHQDYDTWRNNFGRSLAGISALAGGNSAERSGSIPEPASVLLWLLAVAAFYSSVRGWRR